MLQKVALVFLGTLFLTSCAISRTGPPGLLLSSGSTQNLQNMTLIQVVEQYGSPDLAYEVEGKTYWVYRRHRGVFVYLYFVSWGAIERRDLQLEFANGKLVRVNDYRSGSTGAFELYGAGGRPGSIAE